MFVVLLIISVAIAWSSAPIGNKAVTAQDMRSWRAGVMARAPGSSVTYCSRRLPSSADTGTRLALCESRCASSWHSWK